MVEASLNALGVVERFDVVEQRGPQVRSRRPLAVVVDPGELTFEGGEEGLDGGVDAPIVVKLPPAGPLAWLAAGASVPRSRGQVGASDNG
jgi:hypothetical protein